MRMQGYGNDLEKPLHIYGNQKVHEMFHRASKIEGRYDHNRLIFNEIEAYQSFKIKDYKVTALLAEHDSKESCFIYQIEHKGKSILYGHDTGFFPDSVWEYWDHNAIQFDIVVLDCTSQALPGDRNHMGFEANLKIKEKMQKMGLVHNKTQYVITHFSHNSGLTHQETEAWANANNFIAIYYGDVPSHTFAQII